MQADSRRNWTMAIGAVVLIGLIALAGYLASVLWPRVVVVEQKSVAQPGGAVAARPGLQDFDDLVATACPAVVSIVAAESQDEPAAVAGDKQDTPTKASNDEPADKSKGKAASDAQASAPATGFFVDPDGSIVAATASLPAGDAFTVRLSSGKPVASQRVGDDAATGLSLLRAAGGDYPFARFATATFPRAAQWLVAVAAPAARGCTAAVTTVAADSLALGDDTANYLELASDLDAGAPVFNAEGRVVAVGGIGVPPGFSGGTARVALPASLAQRQIGALAHDKPTTDALGLVADDLTPSLAARFGIDDDRRGAYVALVVPGSPADDAGVRVGDIAVSLDKRPIARARDLDGAAFDGDQPLQLAVDRGGVALTLTIQPPPPKGDQAKTGKTAG
ncbi:PDZ domain-containing protein [Sphingomonas koreensis]|nr:PDZ domain-containing protein [Sphingomonas koreensis]